MTTAAEGRRVVDAGPLGTESTPSAGTTCPAAVRCASRTVEQDPDALASVRDPSDRLDAVIDLLGELVAVSASASLLARRTRMGALIEAVERIGELVEDLRGDAAQMRMVRIGDTFAHFERVVRDASGEPGKSVVLEILGGDTELDKSIAARIVGPLGHLVRRALDHGLEPAAEREAAGKPAQGRLTLSARHDANCIVLRIEDDGRGIAPDTALAPLGGRGLPEGDGEPAQPAIRPQRVEPESSAVLPASGRSGNPADMDIVRRTVEALRGTLTLTGAPGHGTVIEIRVPPTLAVIDGFLVGVGASRFVFPLDAVVEVIQRPTLDSASDEGDGPLVAVRGRPLPVVNLRQLYELPASARARGSIVIIQSGTQRYGVLVDTLLGPHRTVIKPLGRLFKRLRGVGGSSILGDGRVALIVDIASLPELVTARSARLADLLPDAQETAHPSFATLKGILS